MDYSKYTNEELKNLSEIIKNVGQRLNQLKYGLDYKSEIDRMVDTYLWDAISDNEKKQAEIDAECKKREI